MNRFSWILWVVCAALPLGCSECGGGRSTGSRGEPGSVPGGGRASAGGDMTGAPDWSVLDLGGDEKDFAEALASWLALTAEAAAKAVDCHGVAAIPVIDRGQRLEEERPAGDADLRACVLAGGVAPSSSQLASARGVFLDGALVRLELGFRLAGGDAVLGGLVRAMGEPTQEVVTVRFGPAEQRRESSLWEVDGEIWGAWRLDEDLLMTVRQRADLAGRLRPSPPPPRRGEPVSLEEIGIGDLDLGAPLPDLTGLVSGDAGVGDGG